VRFEVLTAVKMSMLVFWVDLKVDTDVSEERTALKMEAVGSSFDTHIHVLPSGTGTKFRRTVANLPVNIDSVFVYDETSYRSRKPDIS
jgi:hypothetical protein